MPHYCTHVLVGYFYLCVYMHTYLSTCEHVLCIVCAMSQHFTPRARPNALILQSSEVWEDMTMIYRASLNFVMFNSCLISLLFLFNCLQLWKSVCIFPYCPHKRPTISWSIPQCFKMHCLWCVKVQTKHSRCKTVAVVGDSTCSVADKCCRPSQTLWVRATVCPTHMGHVCGCVTYSATTNKQTFGQMTKRTCRHTSSLRCYAMLTKSQREMPERILRKFVDEGSWILRCLLCAATNNSDFWKHI